MLNRIGLSAMSALVLFAGCVTINVYFPAAAAEKAADRVIDDVWGPHDRGGAEPPQQTPPPSQGSLDWPRLAMHVLDFVVPPARAAEPEIDISSPAVQAIIGDMEKRYSLLKPFYESGAVGLTQDATVAIRNMGIVSLAKRNQLKQLVAEENADRNALYREIAQANGHPEWQPKIRATFARRWIDKARDGWYYQNDDGDWVQK